MTFDDWAIEYFGKDVDFPEACRDAWNAAREQCAIEIGAMADTIPDGDTDSDALRWVADRLRLSGSD